MTQLDPRCGRPAGAVTKELARLQALLLVIEALTQPEGKRPGGAAAARQQGAAEQQQQQVPELTEVQQLLHCGKVAWWLATQQFATDRPTGRFASEQEWRAVVAKRRDACQPATPFLPLLLSALTAQVRRFRGGGKAAPPHTHTHPTHPHTAPLHASPVHPLHDPPGPALPQGVEGMTYPPAGVERLVQQLFLSGGTSQVALHAKLALLAYYLLDGGFAVSGSLAQGLRSGVALPPRAPRPPRRRPALLAAAGRRLPAEPARMRPAGRASRCPRQSPTAGCCSACWTTRRCPGTLPPWPSRRRPKSCPVSPG